MLKQENEQFVRVHKTRAKNLFAKGRTIYMMGNKTRLGNMWVQPVPMTKERSFDWNVNNFNAYLEPQLGNDVAYYITNRKELISEVKKTQDWIKSVEKKNKRSLR